MAPKWCSAAAKNCPTSRSGSRVMSSCAKSAIHRPTSRSARPRISARRMDFVIGSPTRFGNMAAQVKSLIDGLGGLWGKGELEGKPAGVFTSTATTHGGQESTLISMMIPLIHLGMVIVGVPYSTPGMLHTEVRGGTPYGATTIAGGAGELSPAPQDLDIAAVLGRRVAEITKKLRG